MMIKTVFYLSVLAVVIAFTSCKKEQQEVKKLPKIIRDSSFNDTIYFFDYDEKNRLTFVRRAFGYGRGNVEITYDSNNRVVKFDYGRQNNTEFQYDGNLVKFTVDGYGSGDSAILNDKGQCVELWYPHYLYPSYSLSDNYIYNSNGNVVKCISNGKEFSIIDTVMSFSPYADTVELSYSKVPAIMRYVNTPEWIFITNVLLSRFSFFFNSSGYMIQSRKNGNLIINYTYELDSDGYVSKIKFPSDVEIVVEYVLAK